MASLARPLRFLTDRLFGGVLPDAFALLIPSIATAALDGSMVAPGLSKQWTTNLEEHVARNGRFTKFSTMYAAVHPPPVAWPYYCGKCRFWQETGHAETGADPNVRTPVGQCKLVLGDINFSGWCSIWSPPDRPGSTTLEPPLASYRWYWQDRARLLRGLPEAAKHPLGRER